MTSRLHAPCMTDDDSSRRAHQPQPHPTASLGRDPQGRRRPASSPNASRRRRRPPPGQRRPISAVQIALEQATQRATYHYFEPASTWRERRKAGSQSRQTPAYDSGASLASGLSSLESFQNRPMSSRNTITNMKKIQI